MLILALRCRPGTVRGAPSKIRTVTDTAGEYETSGLRSAQLRPARAHGPRPGLSGRGSGQPAAPDPVTLRDP